MKPVKTVALSNDSYKGLMSFGLEKWQVEMINSPTPAQWIKKRKGRGGKEFDYIPVGVVIKCLNTVFGFGWSFEIVENQILQQVKQVLVKGRLTVHIKDKIITKEQFASKEIAVYGAGTPEKPNPRAGEYISIGDDMKGAASLCLTKCASMLGLFSDIYSSEFYAKWEMPDGEDAVETNVILFETIIKMIETIKEPERKSEIAWREITENKILTDEQKKKLQTYVV